MVAASAAGIGGLTESGVPENDAHVYAEGVRRGGTLVTARVDDDVAPKARERHGPKIGGKPRRRILLRSC